MSHRPVPALRYCRDLASGFVLRSVPGTLRSRSGWPRCRFYRLAERERELRERAHPYQRPGYLAAAEAARRFTSALQDAGGDLPTVAATADVFVPADLAALPTADLVVTDVPHGEQTIWEDAAPPAGEALP